MRGRDERGDGPFSYVDLEPRVPADHPLRAIRVLVDEALADLSADFERLYSRTGRSSDAPEKPLRALLLQTFYTIRSERQLMEQLDYSLLFRWFVGISMDAPVWDATTFSKNRDRLVAGDVASRFLQAVLRGARARRLLSDEDFSVDGTMIEAWVSMKSFRRTEGGDEDPPPGRNAVRDFHGERRFNATHGSATDLDARLYRKGDGRVSKLGTPRKTRIDRRTTRHSGYAASRRLHKRIEEGIGRIRTTGGLAKTRHRGLERVGWMFTLSAAAYDLVRLPRLLAEAPS